jgi:hypothetical protein
LCINPPDDHYLDPVQELLKSKPMLDAEGRARLADPAAPMA